MLILKAVNMLISVKTGIGINISVGVSTGVGLTLK
jgi:hypothetical protein